MDAIQKYQQVKNSHRQAELNIVAAKAQVEMYRKEISDILASEGVATIEELSAKYQEKQKELEAVTAVLQKEVDTANEVLAKLGQM